MLDLKPPLFQSLPRDMGGDSYGDEVVALCREVGYVPDPEQELILRALFTYEDEVRDGEVEPLASAYEACVIAPRQNLKSGVGKMAVLGWMFVTKEEVVTWTAQVFSTCQEMFNDLSNIIDNTPMLRRRMAQGKTNGIHSARGSEHFETRDGREVRFRTRTPGNARGLTGDKLVLDEAYALREDHMGAILPTLTAVPDPQLLFLSSAGLVNSHVLRGLRDRGRAGGDRLAYFEWGAPETPCMQQVGGQWTENTRCLHIQPGKPDWKPGCALDDEKLWAQANPLLGRRRANGTGLTLTKMRGFRAGEPPAEFARERLGWWDDAGSADVFGGGHWTACLGERPEDARLEAVGVAVSIDLSRAALVGATGSRRAPAVKVLQYGLGTDWVIDRLAELRRDHPGVRFVADGTGPAGSLLREVDLWEQLPQNDPLGVIRLSTDQALDAVADIFQAVVERRLVHEGDPELDEHVAMAVRRDVRDRWLWGRRGAGGDTSLLEAATWAVWALAEAPQMSVYETRGVMTV